MAKPESYIPKLRFSGFSDKWQKESLSNLLIFSNGINASKESYGQGRKMISVLDILDAKAITYSSILNSVAVDEITEQRNKVINGDLVFVRSSEVVEEVGWVKAYLDDQYALHSGFTICGTKIAEFNSFFLELSLNFANRKEIERKAGGSTRYNVSQSILNELELYKPNDIEQTKIGNFFQKIDQVIELQQKALETAQDYKKAMLQKMFPQKGKKVPQVRFDGFSGNWKEKKVGDVSKSFSGGTPNVDNRDFYNNGTIPFIRSGEISKKQTELFITELALEQSSAKIVNKGDVLYALYGATSGEVARSQIHGAINQAILAILPNDKNDSEYLAQILSLSKKNIISKYLQGGQGNLSGAIIKSIKLLFPKLEEQEKIGVFFQKLDQQIEQQEKKLENYQKLKKAMLQRMFV